MALDYYEHTYPFDPNVKDCLRQVQEDVLEAGDYHGGENNHTSIEAARAEAGEEGTGSILDLRGVSEEPEDLSLWVLAEEEYEDYFDTETPTAEEILRCQELLEVLHPGQGIAVIAHEEEEPVNWVFMGIPLE